jgi:hypothetical protein
LESFNFYLGSCGKLYKNINAFELNLGQFSDLSNKIIPFLEKYTIKGDKSLD